MKPLSVEQMFVAISAANDQDLEHCRQWFREATNEDLVVVWIAIQQMPEIGPLQIIARLAQLQFGMLAVEKFGPSQSEDV